jgi:Skp family chaperone for outer membrane proteins
MRYVTGSCAALALLLILPGCGNQSSPAANATTPPSSDQPTGRVGIIDLDVVAKLLGRDKQLVQTVKQQELALNQQLQTMQASYVEQFNAKQQEYGPQPTVEQAKHLQTLKNQINTHLLQTKQKAQISLNQHRSGVVKQFQEEVRPFAQQVAAQRELTLIVPKNDGLVFAVDPAVDISADVAKAMQAATASNPPAALPAGSAESAQPLAPSGN